ncbi:MAG: hypothetical protein Q7S83_00600 [bacterium]|nr:hypothetical protein [bacterium]
MDRWLELAGKVEKAFPFKFDWERLVWQARMNIGDPLANAGKKGKAQGAACSIPIVTLRVDLLRDDRLSDAGLPKKPISISQALCQDIVFVPWEHRLAHKIYDSIDALAKDIVIQLEKTRN